MGLSLTDLTLLKDEAFAAYQKALKALSYTVNLGGTARSVARQQIVQLKKDLLYWQGEVDKAAIGGQGSIPTKFGTSNQ